MFDSPKGISDIEFDPASGEASRMVVDTDEGKSDFAPGVLRSGCFPPLMQPLIRP